MTAVVIPARPTRALPAVPVFRRDPGFVEIKNGRRRTVRAKREKLLLKLYSGYAGNVTAETPKGIKTAQAQAAVGELLSRITPQLVGRPLANAPFTPRMVTARARGVRNRYSNAARLRMARAGVKPTFKIGGVSVASVTSPYTPTYVTRVPPALTPTVMPINGYSGVKANPSIIGRFVSSNNNNRGAKRKGERGELEGKEIRLS